MLACGQRALARVSYMGSTRAKARREHKPNGPLFHRCVAPFCAGIDTKIISEVTVSSMASKKPILGLVNLGRQRRGAAAIGMNPLHEPMVGFADLRFAGIQL